MGITGKVERHLPTFYAIGRGIKRVLSRPNKIGEAWSVKDQNLYFAMSGSPFRNKSLLKNTINTGSNVLNKAPFSDQELFFGLTKIAKIDALNRALEGLPPIANKINIIDEEIGPFAQTSAMFPRRGRSIMEWINVGAWYLGSLLGLRPKR
jgi:hypothetical protein